MIIELISYLYFAISLFVIGLLGIFVIRKNIIIVLMSVELLLLGININFVVFSVYLDDILGQIFSLLVLTVAAAESALGLAILVIFYRLRGVISIQDLALLKN
jgi:NADH-quinone oxidoreductase subunit K